MSEKLSVLLANKPGETSIRIDAEVLESGDVQVTGHDVGKAPRTFFGDSDYKYWLTVPADEKDRLVLALLETLYKGDSEAVSKLHKVLESKAILHSFNNY